MRILIPTLSMFLLFCGVLSVPAAARPRDEVMINVYRCAGHPATRTWLDCYYGAAQPQRAALRLVPAPPAQVQLSQSPPAPGLPQDTAARDSVIAGAARCGGALEERAWLDCYYGAANPVRAILGLATVAGAAPPPPPMPAARPIAPRPAPRAARNQSGFFSVLIGRGRVHAAARMTSYQFDGDGMFTVTLANGQTWQQLEGDTSKAHWPKPAGSYQVTVTDGAFDTFNMTVKGVATAYKVRQLPPF